MYINIYSYRANLYNIFHMGILKCMQTCMYAHWKQIAWICAIISVKARIPHSITLKSQRKLSVQLHNINNGIRMYLSNICMGKYQQSSTTVSRCNRTSLSPAWINGNAPKVHCTNMDDAYGRSIVWWKNNAQKHEKVVHSVRLGKSCERTWRTILINSKGNLVSFR